MAKIGREIESALHEAPCAVDRCQRQDSVVLLNTVKLTNRGCLLKRILDRPRIGMLARTPPSLPIKLEELSRSAIKGRVPI
jgi:hypothetical protein